MFFAEYVQEDEKLWPILAAFLAGFSISLNSPKKFNIYLLSKGSKFYF